MNCTVVEHGDDMLLIDCGMTFPDDDLGVDTIHPDFGYVLQHRDRLRAVVLTHGHEDHIGALPYLLQELTVPVYGPAHALSLVRERLEEHDLPEQPALHEVAPRERFLIGSLEIEPYRVTHSIPDCTGLCIRCDAGTFVHSGDFRIDEDPVDGQHFDKDFLRGLGDEGVRALLSDSTNVTVERTIGSEREVAVSLRSHIEGASGRVIISMFASNIYRLMAIFDAARATGRKVVLMGRSLQTHARVGRQLGYLEDAGDLLIGADVAKDYPRASVIIAATGSQGEHRAALSRLARGDHHQLKLSAGDLVLLSSRIIPGKEPLVYEMLDRLLRLGVEVVHRGDDPTIHVSGHASRAEQSELIELLRPRTFVPIHGTLYHLTRHAELARSLGVEETVVIENGLPVEFDATGHRVAKAVRAGKVSTQQLRAIPEIVLRDRELLARVGICIAAVALDEQGYPCGPPSLLTRGVVHEDASAALLRDARDAADDALQGGKPPWTETRVIETVCRVVRRVLRQELGYRPSVHCLVSRVDE